MRERRPSMKLKGGRSFHPPVSDRRIQAKGEMPLQKFYHPGASRPSSTFGSA